jgi:hypothetical protein
MGSANDAVVVVDVSHETHSSATALVTISTDLPAQNDVAHFGISVRGGDFE